MITTATDLACKIVSRLVDDTDGPFMEFCIGEGERSNAEAAVRELLQQAMQDYDNTASLTAPVSSSARPARTLEHEALEWLTNICCGVSKDGGSDISQQEWNECIQLAKDALLSGGEK